MIPSLMEAAIADPMIWLGSCSADGIRGVVGSGGWVVDER